MNIKIPFLDAFSSLKADKVFDTVSRGVDKLAFTSQEKSELNMKLADKVAEFTKDSLNESTIRSSTRRFVAKIVITVYLFLVILYVLLTVMGYPTAELKEMVTESPLTTAFVMVLVFFFGGYYAKSLGINFTKKNKEETK